MAQRTDTPISQGNNPISPTHWVYKPNLFYTTRQVFKSLMCFDWSINMEEKNMWANLQFQDC